MKYIISSAFLFICFTIFSQDLAIVNGQPVTYERVDQFIKLLLNQGAVDSEELHEQVKQEIINRQIFLQEANKIGIPERIDVQNELEFARESIIVRALMDDYLDNNLISDIEIQTEYNKLKKEKGNIEEFKIRHILSKDETESIKILKKIKKNRKKFGSLAKENSKDFGSAEKNGDLGWITLDDYEQSFAEAIRNMNKDEITNQPIQTRFGWHIIHLEDIRSIEFPSLDQVRSQIENILHQRMLLHYQKNLRDNSIVLEK